MFSRNSQDEAAALARSRQQVHHALQQAQAHGLVAYDGLDWPVAGTVWFGVGADGVAVVHMGPVSEADFKAMYEAKFAGVLYRDAERTDPVRATLEAYLNGRIPAVDVPIDWSQMTPFQAQVLRAAARIPAGQVMTYGQLAERIDKPGAARAVGRALGTNPMPIVIPCHRVVASDGRLAGYIGGLAVKRHLLQMEGAPVAS